MSRRRRLLLVFAIAMPVSLGVVWVAFWLAKPHTAISRQYAARIHPGMTQAEVEKILGGQCRDESTGPLCSDESVGEDVDRSLTKFFGSWGLPRNAGPPTPLEWRSDWLIILVALDEDDRVAVYDMIDVHRVGDSPLAVIRRWLHL